MTREKLTELRVIVAEQCNKLLESARTNGVLLSKDYTVIKEKFSITVEEKPNQQKLLELQEFLTEHKNLSLTMESMLYSSGRYDYFKYVKYIATSYELVNEVPEEVITGFMKSIVKKQLGLYKHDYLDCKVMKMFKEGIITWEETKRLHHEDCSL